MMKIKPAVFLLNKAFLDLFWDIVYWCEFASSAALNRRNLNQLTVAVVNPAAVFLSAKLCKFRKGQKAHGNRRQEEDE